MTSPPDGVKMVMEAACIMFDEKPKITVDPQNIKRRVADYWDVTKKVNRIPCSTCIGFTSMYL